MTNYNFTTRLAMLVGIDLVITIIDSYIPHDWTPIRVVVALVQLGFMAATMFVALQNVLQDY